MEPAEQVKGDSICPNCSSKDISGDNISIDVGIAWQNVSCNNCNAVWDNNYIFTGYSNLYASITEEA